MHACGVCYAAASSVSVCQYVLAGEKVTKIIFYCVPINFHTVSSLCFCLRDFDLDFLSSSLICENVNYMLRKFINFLFLDRKIINYWKFIIDSGCVCCVRISLVANKWQNRKKYKIASLCTTSKRTQQKFHSRRRTQFYCEAEYGQDETCINLFFTWHLQISIVRPHRNIASGENVLGSEFVLGKYWQFVEQRGSNVERTAGRWGHTAGLQRSEQKPNTIVSGKQGRGPI